MYTRGRYSLGPRHEFLTYQADAHLEQLDELEVFSAGVSNSSIGLSFKVDVDLTYLLIKEEIGVLHEELASSYRSVVLSRAKDAIKNEAIFVTFRDYFQNRKEVEARFARAVQKRWNAKPELHCELDQFHVGRIQIPESVAEKQLEAKIQNERNDREAFLQQAQIEREMTDVEVNKIALEEEKVTRTAKAEASLIRAKARVQAQQLQADAQTNGTIALVQAADIATQEHLTAFTYIRTLTNRDKLNLNVDYLASDSVLRTRSV